MPAYAELQVTSNFSFLRGASHPEEMVDQAHLLGHTAIAVTDRSSFAGIVRAHCRAKEIGMRLVVGCRLDPEDTPPLLCWPVDRSAYARLSSLLTLGKRRAAKASCTLGLADILAHDAGQIFAVIPPDEPDEFFLRQLAELAGHWRGRLHLVLSHRYAGNDRGRLERLAELARHARVKLLATNDVHYHVPERRALQDVVTCIREHCTIALAGGRLMANAERHLKPAAEMARLFDRYPEALESTQEIVERCRFSLDELAYDYPVPGLL